MTIKYNITTTGCEVRTMGKNGIETVVIHGFEKALLKDQIVRSIRNNTQAAGSMRQASLSFIHVIQESGVLKSWFNNGKVVGDLLKKMREAEDKQAIEWGMTSDDIAEMRKPGSYADSRSHAIKAWASGVALKTGIDEKGNVNLLTTSALRQINASMRKEPEKAGINDLLAKVAEYLVDHPQDAFEAERQMANMIKAAKSMLDSAALILAGQTQVLESEVVTSEYVDKAGINTVKDVIAVEKSVSRKAKATMLHASKQPIQANKLDVANKGMATQ